MDNPITCLDIEEAGTRLVVQWIAQVPPGVACDEDRVRIHFRKTLPGGVWDETTIWITPQEAMLIESGLATARTCEACAVPVEEGDANGTD